MDYVTFVCGSQMGKTDGVLLNDIGRTLDEDPRPILYIGPTQKNVESLSNDRVTKMIHSIPTLYDNLLKGRWDKTSEKFVNGVRLGFGWAGSATEVASHPAAKAYIDERDRMSSISGEGDINELIEPRVSTYDGVIVTTSTPLIGTVSRTKRQLPDELDFWEQGDKDDVQSPTWQLWQEGSRHEWAWPCPECHVYFIPHSGLLVFDENDHPETVFENTVMACPCCGAIITNDVKEEMNDRGVFVKPGQTIAPCKRDTDTCAYVSGQEVPYGSYLAEESVRNMSFWVSGLCSPWRSFGHRARAYTRGIQSGETERIQAAVNTGYGELYMPKGEAPEWETVAACRRPYERGTVPQGVQVIVAGVDVQKDRLYWRVRGFGANYASWGIDEGEIYGETKHQYVWDQLATILEDTWDGIPISIMLVDSGYKPNEGPAETHIVYQFCRMHHRAFPAKGWETRTRTHQASKIDVSWQGKIVKGGLTLWNLDSDYFKTFLYTRIEWSEEENQMGGYYLHMDTEDEFCRQVVAEARTVTPTGRAKWEQLRSANHYLDCEALCYAGAHILRLHTLKPDDGPRERRTEQSSAAPVRGRRVRSKGIE